MAVAAIQRQEAAKPSELRIVSHAIERMLTSNLVKDTGANSHLERETNSIRERLNYIRSPEIERLMIDRVVMTWLRLLVAESQMNSATCGGNPKILDAVDKLLLRANTRFIRSVEALAKLRRLRGATDDHGGSLSHLFAQRPSGEISTCSTTDGTRNSQR